VKRGKGDASAGIIAELGEAMRMVLASVPDMGEVVLSKITDAAETLGTKRALRAHGEHAHNQHSLFSTIFTMGGVIWRKTKASDTFLFLRPARADHTMSLALPIDSQRDNDVPAELTDTNTVFQSPDGDLLIKTVNGKLDITVANGKDCTITVLGGGHVALGGSGAADFLIKGTTYRSAQQTMDTTVQTTLAAAAAALSSAGANPAFLAAFATAAGFLTTAGTQLAAAAAAFGAFEGGATGFLSQVSKTT